MRKKRPKTTRFPGVADVQSLADDLGRLEAASAELQRQLDGGAIEIEAMQNLARELMRAEQKVRSQMANLDLAIAEIEKIMP